MVCSKRADLLVQRVLSCIQNEQTHDPARYSSIPPPFSFLRSQVEGGGPETSSPAIDMERAAFPSLQSERVESRGTLLVEATSWPSRAKVLCIALQTAYLALPPGKRTSAINVAPITKDKEVLHN